VELRLLLGPAGSGKTFRCLAEIRQALNGAPEGPPLLLLAPKQTTYQLERQLLSDPALTGYTRLHILSFERLAWFIFERLGIAAPGFLEDEGRVMVLRALLAQRREELQLFRASARLTGFAQQLSQVLSELQKHELTPGLLRQMAVRVGKGEGLSFKLQDLSTLLEEYLAWLASHQLQDAERLLPAATAALQALGGGGPAEQVERGGGIARPGSSPMFGHLWVDGFGELSESELALLGASLPHCADATITFCLDSPTGGKHSWLSNWSVARRMFESCQKRLGGLPGVIVRTETLERRPKESRFRVNPVLQHLERAWSDPRPYPGPERDEAGGDRVARALRLAVCFDPEAEATVAAREILAHVRRGGRFREVTVLVRALGDYHTHLQRVFARYQVPFFLDRREPVSHHPLAELTRSALRTILSQWRRQDWFAALKSGLVPATDEEIDRLENEALARGWQGAAWQKPLQVPREPELTAWLVELQPRLVSPFQRLALALAARQNRPTGPQLAAALREFWQELEVESRLAHWAADEAAGEQSHPAGAVHATVWEQMQAWLHNVELAFAAEPLGLRQWLPILEAGLSGLTVGVIPPALDQVLIGDLDRSRNPDVKLALVLGLNEGVFPAPPQPGALLTDLDRTALEERGVALNTSARRQLARERFLAYLACTRASERVVFTTALNDAAGSPLNPSPFISQLEALFPTLRQEEAPRLPDWRESEHVHELIGPVLRARHARPATSPPLTPALETLPALAAVLDRLQHFHSADPAEALAPNLPGQLYGPVLRSSVSRLEKFGECPFKFFVHSGLHAQDRQRFELDAKEQGTFQHDVLAYFHEELRDAGKRWRDITPDEARARVERIAAGFMASYRDGLLQATEETRFMARILTESLQDFVGTLVDWMRAQYEFDPAEVELPFGEADTPPWTLELAGGWRLELQGRIDRVDLWRVPGADTAWCVVLDYKSSEKKLEPDKVEAGLQLQLLTYLNVLRQWPNPEDWFGVRHLLPGGVFYVNLRGKYANAANRAEAIRNAEQARKLAYLHTGRFNRDILRHLDHREGIARGDQFNFRLNKDGSVNGRSREPMTPEEFNALLDRLETRLREAGARIFAGEARVFPYRKGGETACERCDYRAVCRTDPWTQEYRNIAKAAAGDPNP
jgi:ATP-dependent helicase/nuclease subunit B